MDEVEGLGKKPTSTARTGSQAKAIGESRITTCMREEQVLLEMARQAVERDAENSSPRIPQHL
jgi:hypothetical protein